MSHDPAPPATVFLTAAASPWGAENSMAIIAQELGAAAPVGFLCDSSETTAFIRDRGLPEPMPVRPVRNRVFKLFAFHREVIRRAPRSRVVLFSLQLAPLAFLLRADPRFRGRVVLDVHDVPHGGFDRTAARACAAFAHRVIAISAYTRSALGLPERTAVVPRPISAAEPAERTGDVSHYVLGIVGRVDREKRLDVAVRTVAVLPDDTVLHIYGQPFLDPGWLEDLRRLAAEAAPGRVVFRGVQPPEVIYGEIDALLVCNDNEPSGRTVGEAMVRGVLPVVPDRGGALEYLPAELMHLVYAAGNPDSAAAVIRGLRTGITAAQREAARAWVMHARSAETVGRQYEAVLSR